MSKKIKTTLIHPQTKKKLIEDKYISLGDGYCKFPFLYDGNEYDDCTTEKLGVEWCATELNKKKKSMKKYAYCQKEVVPATPTIEAPGLVETQTTASKAPKKSKGRGKGKSKSTLDLEAKSDTSKPKTVKKGKKTFNILNIENINPKYYIPNKDKLTHKEWTLPNRKLFSRWMESNYDIYKAIKNSMSSASSKTKFELFKHQKLVRDYLQTDSPYRGLLLFHGLGVGKTCASIAIAEGFRSNRDIIVVLNKSLVKNFKGSLLLCGYEYFNKNHNWNFFKKSNKEMIAYATLQIGIPKSSINKLNGVWLIDFENPENNYDSLANEQQSQIMIQISDMIDHKYRFEHLNGLTRDRLVEMSDKNEFDNKLVIFDEVHNLTNAISKKVPGVRGAGLKKLIMEAENLKLVFLSGTPMINNLFEVGQLFNLLRGYIYNYKFTLTPRENAIPFDEVVDNLYSSPLVDQLIVKKKDNIINIVRPPYGFINTGNGVVKSSENNINITEFTRIMTDTFNTYNYSVKVDINKYTSLPNDLDEFMRTFYDDRNNTLKNTELFKSRIMGLVSYFRTGDKALLPTVTKDDVIKIKMSNYQFLGYSKVRKIEINQSKSKASSSKKPSKDGDGSLFDDKKSSYRAYSRMHCSFVFPEGYDRPTPSAQEIFEENEESELEIDNVSQPLERDYEQQKIEVLDALDRNKERLFTMDGKDELLKFSPKYNRILKTIEKTNGLAFIYTEYKTLEGIAILRIIFKANGYAPFLLQKNANGEYIQVFENEEDKDKPKFAFWGGNEEESDIIRKIYNNQFSLLPNSIRTQMMSIGKNNLHGEIIKVLMTTKTGAEGIDLQNVRQVHIVEPYWNPVRTEQVKGRAVRVNSHKQLPKDEQNVEIYTYLSEITPEDLKKDITIRDDKDGKTSDQVLFDISQKKLEVMNHLLQLIKEASIDCKINKEETKGDSNVFDCMSSPAGITYNDYSYVPNIKDDYDDDAKSRRILLTQKDYSFKIIPIKGKNIEFGVKESKVSSEPNLLFYADKIRSGDPGEPIGSYIISNRQMKLNFFNPKDLKKYIKKYTMGGGGKRTKKRK